jgi:hypothetical protein
MPITYLGYIDAKLQYIGDWFSRYDDILLIDVLNQSPSFAFPNWVK